MTTPGQVLVARNAPPPPAEPDLDRSFNELFDAPEDLRAKTLEILSPIVENAAPPFQRLLPLPMSVPRPLAAKTAGRYRSAPPEFRPSLPVLPRQLHHLVDAAIIPSAFHTSHKQRRAMPPWLMTGLIAFLMAITGIAIVNFIVPSKAAATATAPTATPLPEPSPAPPPPVANPAPLSKRMVELTGFRVRPDKSGKTSVQYVVINHSEADMRGLTAHVVLRSATAKPFQAPIANFTVRLPNMTSLESKDLTTLVETPIDRSVPDWTELRAEVRIEQ